MITYQEYIESIEKGEQTQFIQSAINKHRQSDEYLIAVDAENYMKKRNTTVCAFQKLIYDVAGMAHIDPVSANFKCASGFFKQIVTQIAQYSTANGVTFLNADTKSKLGGERFDGKLSALARNALVGGVAFAFFDFDRIQPFKLTEFVPMWDENTGTLAAGVRFWQLAETKPLRADLYTIEGVQSFIRPKGGSLGLMDGNELPRPYKVQRNVYSTGLVEVIGGENYPTLPIVPFYANKERQSELIGLKENIDAYDLIKSGLVDDISDMPLIFWTLENAGGMSEADLAFWKDRINRNKVSMTDDEVRVTANTIGVPYAAQEAVLTRLEKDIYSDAMALNTRALAAGNVTATAIRAASEPLNHRADELEDCLRDGIEQLLQLLGLSDSPTFTRSEITNESEETQMVLSARDYLDSETILNHLKWLTPEEREAVPARLAAEARERAPFVEAE